MKTIIVGLGNPILGDDGVGWKVAEEVKKQLDSPCLRHSSHAERSDKRTLSVSRRARSAVEAGRGGEGDISIEFLSLGGISLMEHLIGFERAILIDAIASDEEPGSVMRSSLNEMPQDAAFHTTSAHDISLQNALKLGKTMGANLPEQVIVVGIATNHVYDFGEELSLPVAKAILRATQFVIDLL